MSFRVPSSLALTSSYLVLTVRSVPCSDPVVRVEALGEKYHTTIKWGQLSCVFDELFIFNRRGLDKEDFK
jgi:hypothetical protein